MDEQYPTLLERIQSAFIDTIFIIIVIITFVNITDKYNLPDSLKIIFICILIAYEPIAMTFGCTLGNFIKGIRVRNDSNPLKKINIFQAILRYFIKIILGWVSFFTIHSNPKRQAIHDLISGSVLIKKKIKTIQINFTL